MFLFCFFSFYLHRQRNLLDPSSWAAHCWASLLNHRQLNSIIITSILTSLRPFTQTSSSFVCCCSSFIVCLDQDSLNQRYHCSTIPCRSNWNEAFSRFHRNAHIHTNETIIDQWHRIETKKSNNPVPSTWIHLFN